MHDQTTVAVSSMKLPTNWFVSSRSLTRAVTPLQRMRKETSAGKRDHDAGCSPGRGSPWSPGRSCPLKPLRYRGRSLRSHRGCGSSKTGHWEKHRGCSRGFHLRGQLPLKEIQSDEAEGTLMLFPVHANVDTFHETIVHVEEESSGGASSSVCSRPGAR